MNRCTTRLARARIGGELGQQRIAGSSRGPRRRHVAGARRAAQQPGFRHQAAQGQGTHAHARAAQQLASRQDDIFQVEADDPTWVNPSASGADRSRQSTTTP